MKKLMNVTMTQEAIQEATKKVLASDKSKSGKMKDLFNLGLELKEIASLMEVRYNFVYNVVQNMVIVEGVEVENTRMASKKDAVWGLLDTGKTVKEIAIELKTNYNYIYKLKKEWEAEVKAEVAKIEEEEVKTETKTEVKATAKKVNRKQKTA